MPVTDLVIPAHRHRLADALRTVSTTSVDCIARAWRTDGTMFHAELRLGEVVQTGEHLVAISARDDTTRHRTEAQLGLLAYSDPLTGLRAAPCSPTGSGKSH